MEINPEVYKNILLINPTNANKYNAKGVEGSICHQQVFCRVKLIIFIDLVCYYFLLSLLVSYEDNHLVSFLIINDYKHPVWTEGKQDLFDHLLRFTNIIHSFFLAEKMINELFNFILNE